MTDEAQSIMVNPLCPCKIHNNPVNSHNVLVNPRSEVYPKSQLINNGWLQWYILGIDLQATIMALSAFGSGHYGCPEAKTKAIALQAILNLQIFI